jgi:DNA/RNA endonuclease YhcR with UshA esterase domain
MAAAFILGTQERRFFNFIYQVAGVILAVPQDAQQSGLGIAEVTPGSGPTGIDVTIRGQGFSSGSVVKFGCQSLEATLVSADDISITGRVPQGSGKVDVTVVNPDGAAFVKREAFQYEIPSEEEDTNG